MPDRIRFCDLEGGDTRQALAYFEQELPEQPNIEWAFALAHTLAMMQDEPEPIWRVMAERIEEHFGGEG